MGAHRHLTVVGVVGLGLCAWCAWVSGFHRSTAAAEWTWLASLVAVVAVDVLVWRGRVHRRPGWRLEPAPRSWPPPGLGRWGRLQGVSPWLGLMAVVTAWEALGIDTGTDRPHLTISALAQAFRPLDAALLLVWMAAGVGYGVARARAPAGPPPAEVGGGGLRLGPVGVASVHPVGAVPALLLPASRSVGVGFWLAVLVAGVTVDLVARRGQGRLASGEEFTRWLTGPAVANLAVMAAWTVAGYHLFAR